MTDAASPSGPAGRAWTVVLPVKRAARAKSRLLAGPELARAIALDTIDAVIACASVRRVVVVTDDPELAASLPSGVDVVADREAAGPDAAIGAAMAALGEGEPRAALLADLPALSPADLAHALAAAETVPRSVVADAEGEGSTLVTAAPGIPWRSAFGPGSFARHIALGCTPLDVPASSSLRRDVDVPAHLQSAARLGLGPRTAACAIAPARVAG